MTFKSLSSANKTQLGQFFVLFTFRIRTFHSERFLRQNLFNYCQARLYFNVEKVVFTEIISIENDYF